MKQLLFILLLSSCYVSQMLGQKTTGLIWDDAAYDTIPQLPPYSGEKFKEIPISINLRKYCPIPKDQANLGSCVAWATGYGCLSILHAIEKELTVTQQITREAYSSSFIFNQINKSGDCYTGAKLHDAFELLKSKGDCRISFFPNDNNSCNRKPSDKAFLKAKQSRIKDYVAIFNRRQSSEQKIEQTKLALAMNTPVVIGIEITSSFLNIPLGQNLWNPDNKEPSIGGHAMVVVGYDDIAKEFELLNSYGTDWADKGFVRIPYEVYSRRVKYGYKMVLEGSISKAISTLKESWTELLTFGKGKETNHSILQGLFSLRAPKFLDNGNLVYSTEKIFFDTISNSYKLDKNKNDLYQIVLKNAIRGQYLYVFSWDAADKIELHYPPIIDQTLGRNNITTGLVTIEEHEFVLPSRESALQLTVQGLEKLIILCSEQPIKNISQRIQQIRTESGSVKKRLEACFDGLLINEKYIKYNTNQVGFQSIAPLNSGVIVPTIINISVH